MLTIADAVGFTVFPISWLLKGDQVRAGLNIRSALVRVVQTAQPAKIFHFSPTPNVLQVSTASRNLTTRAVAATSRPRLLLVLLSGSLPSRCLGTDGAPEGNSAQPLGVEISLPLGNVLDSGSWRGRAASTTCARPSPVVEFSARQWRTTDGTLRTGTSHCRVLRWLWGRRAP